jgi:hypothetical protein
MSSQQRAFAAVAVDNLSCCLTVAPSLRCWLGFSRQNKTSEYCAPLTSFDWNEVDTTMIGTCSIDTTCTIWDVTVRCQGVWDQLAPAVVTSRFADKNCENTIDCP